MTKAARELCIAQLLSKTISRLEEAVGVPLFDRHGGRIRLNAFGKSFLDKVEKALALLEEGRKEVSEMAMLFAVTHAWNGQSVVLPKLDVNATSMDTQTVFTYVWHIITAEADF